MNLTNGKNVCVVYFKLLHYLAGHAIYICNTTSQLSPLLLVIPDRILHSSKKKRKKKLKKKENTFGGRMKKTERVREKKKINVAMKGDFWQPPHTRVRRHCPSFRAMSVPPEHS